MKQKSIFFALAAMLSCAFSEASVVAKIGEQGYATLQDAIEAVQEGKTITMTADVELTETLNIPAEKTITLDLNGKTISQEKDCTASYEMINNKGNLTITGNGKISFTDTSAGDPSFGWGSYTVRNEGNLVVENGTIEHLGEQDAHCIMAIFQYCGSTTINGGTISTPNYRSARLWKGEMTINGGTFDGQLWVQAVDNTAKLTVNGGTFEPNGGDASAVFVTNSTYDVDFAVTGGTFNGKVGCSDATKLAGAIKGGKFTETAKNGTNAALLATGLVFGEADANGYYAVEDGPTTHYIATIDELKTFRDNVNSGANYYAGANVVLAADIDMAGENWVGIGSATAEHGFMGNFDGQGYKIKNLTITNPALDSDGYAYAGLFGVTEGTDEDNQNTIKNLTIENVTINTTGHIAAAAIAYPYYTIVDNVKVCGDIKIQGGNYTAGVLAYTRRCVNASNLSIVGNDGSFVEGAKTVGGVISDIQMNGGLTAAYSNFSAEGLTITGEKHVGGISGIICKQTLNGASVKNVTLNCSNASVGIVSGSWGDVSTISNVTVENVSGATAIIGATWKEGAAVEAKIGDTYYATLEAAIEAAQAGETVVLLADVTIDELVKIEKAITIDLGGKKVTSTAKKAFEVYANTTIKNGTIEALNRCVDTRKAVELTLTNVKLVADKYTTYGNPQPLTIGGSENGTKVAMTNVNISAAAGYGIITFVETELTATNSTIGGYNALYVKPGSDNSVFNFVDSDLSGSTASNDVEGNSFSTIAVRANNVTVNVDAASTVTAAGNYSYAISFKSSSQNEAATGSSVTVAGEITAGNILADLSGNTVRVNAEYADELQAAGYATSAADGLATAKAAVAKVGDVYYATVAEAINAAEDGATVQLLAGTIDEYVAPWATDSQHKSEKSITIVGAEDFGTTLTGGLYLGYDDNGCREHTITIEGINFTGKGILVGGQQNVVIKNNKFSEITAVVATSQSANANAISVIGKNVNATVIGNVIAGVEECGIHLRDVINAEVTDNSVSNTNGNSITINPTKGSNGAIVVRNNTLSNWGRSREGRAMRISGGATVTINGNVMSHDNAPEELAKVTDATSLEAAGNYWNGESPVADGIFNTDVVAEPAVMFKNYYTDVEKTNLVEIAASVAKVGNTNYATLEAAIEAAQAGQTVTLLGDVTLAETLNIPTGKTITLDLNGMTISQTKEQTAGYQMILNDGNLTIDDSSEAKTGKISYTDSGNGGEYISDAIYNRGVLVINGGTIENLSSAAVASNGYPHAVDTYSGIRNTSVTINGGTIYCAEYSAIRMFCVSATYTADLVINGGTIKGAIDMQNGTKDAALGTLTITDGTFETTKNANNIRFANWNGGATTYGISAEIKGGSFNGGITTAYVPAAANWDKGIITGGTFATDVNDYCADGFTCEANADGKYTVEELPTSLIIKDTEEYTFDKDIKCDITYKRTLASDNFNALYVPFEIPVNDFLEDYEFFYFNDVHSDENGVPSYFEVIEITSGTLKASHPYLVRPKNADAKNMELVIENTQLRSVTGKKYAVDCSSAYTLFTIRGTYSELNGEDYPGCYGMSVDGDLALIGKGTLGAYRIYLQITDRDTESPVINTNSNVIRLRVVGEGNGEATEIKYYESDAQKTDYIFDLQGRRIMEPQKSGIYIVNGKKMIIK